MSDENVTGTESFWDGFQSGERSAPPTEIEILQRRADNAQRDHALLKEALEEYHSGIEATVVWQDHRIYDLRVQCAQLYALVAGFAVYNGGRALFGESWLIGPLSFIAFLVVIMIAGPSPEDGPKAHLYWGKHKY